MKLHTMLGYKLFKENEDGSISMIRIVYMKIPFKPGRHKDPTYVTVYNYDTNENVRFKVEDFKDYTPLEPDAIFTISEVAMRDLKGQACKDIIVTASKYIDVKLKQLPYAICRQNVTDLFYNLFVQTDSNDMVGMSVNRDTCPAGLDYRIMLAAERMNKYLLINFYRTDTLEDIINLIPDKQTFDNVLSELYTRHCNAVRNPMLLMKDEDMGWCKNLDTLLKENEFEADINQMLGITKVKFVIEPYIIKKKLPGKDEEYDSVSDDLREWLSSIYKLNITDITILEFDHDIDIVEYKETKYFLLRDVTNKLYLVVYNVDGEYFEADLEAKAQEYDFSTKFKIDFYNKYKDINTDNIIQYK